MRGSMRVGVLGINHKLAGLNLRELLAKICQKRLDPGQSTHGEHSFILLSTCNRTEVYFSSEELANTHSYLLGILKQEIDKLQINQDFDQKLYSFFGKNCLAHLSRVAAGLDSAIVAETEIQGQVKQAYETAHEYQKLPHELHYLFQKSLSIAKKARGLLPLKPGLPDIEHAVFQMGQQLFENLYDAKILFIGASRINEKIIGHFKQRRLQHLVLCNRTRAHGEALAKRQKIAYAHWDELAHWEQYDWIIAATRSPEYLLLHGHMSSPAASRKLLIDLSVPRNADPLLMQDPNIHLLNVDQINSQLELRKNRLALSLELAEELVVRTSQNYTKLFQAKSQTQVCAAIA
jgi:glutamyl-tRNA reductase